jgi:UDP-N-acetylglucosamine--N-acetylmuramyl-(pentapeptide) pyrophosphoryl-undecaprenol N-acetylglucosamine transferase
MFTKTTTNGTKALAGADLDTVPIKPNETGVRPSPGAAEFAMKSNGKHSSACCLSPAAAPGHGRTPLVAIACGGTGGHLFPGLAVAEQMIQLGCDVTLLISPKEVDQQAVKMASSMDIITLPAVGLTRGGKIAFLRGFIQSYQTARRYFQTRPPGAVLAMGGFTSAPPLLAARRFGAQTFLHESNTVPGRANRWLCRIVNEAFVGFPSAGKRLKARNVTLTGTPVRPEFQARDQRECRALLGLDPARPVVLVMGGSQGASGINQLVMRSLPLLARVAPEVQFFHLTGPSQQLEMRQAYANSHLTAIVHPFFADTELALSAATTAISRAGASSLAEFAAIRLPAVLIPYPAATDNHQLENSRAFAHTGAACLLEEKNATLQSLSRLLLPLVKNPETREKMQSALARWHAPQAAQQIARTILEAVTERKLTAGPLPVTAESTPLNPQTAHLV